MPLIIIARQSRVPPSNCPWCNAVLDAVTSLEGAKPSPGSVTVCLKCQGISKFDENLKLVKVEEAEFLTWEAEDRLQIRTIQDGLRNRTLRRMT